MNSRQLQFQTEFPSHEVVYDTFIRHVRLVQGKSETRVTLEDVKNRLRMSPIKSLRQLAARTCSNSFITLHLE